MKLKKKHIEVYQGMPDQQLRENNLKFEIRLLDRLYQGKNSKIEICEIGNEGT